MAETVKFARDLKVGERVRLVSGRVVTLDGVSGGGTGMIDLGYNDLRSGASEWHPFPWDTRWTVVN